MTTPFLIADAAEVAIMSPLAEAAFGSYDLQVPDGIDIEDIHDFEAPGNELGYVARLSPQRATGIARRFIRADVAVNAKDDTDPDVIPESDVDRVLSEAESRVESEFFLESDITKAGLGSWVPYVDFNVGDIVNVRIFDIWVNLPVTRIEPIISEGDIVDWRVHVGGQLLSDDQAREVENATIQKELIQDRRELAGLGSQVSQAVKDTSDLAGALGGEGATVDDVKQGMDELAEQHETHDEPPPVGLIDAYIQANNERWRMQEEINDANNAALAAHGAAIEANEKAIKVLMQSVAGFLYVPSGSGEHEDSRIRIVRSANAISVTAKGTWRGSIVGTGTTIGDAANPYVRGDTVPTVAGREYQFEIAGNALIHWQVNPGIVNEYQSENLPVTTLSPSNTWATVDSWQVPNDTELMVVSRWVWVNKTYGGDYYGRVLVNGVDVTDRYTSSSAPLFGHGRRTAQVSTAWIDAPAGALVEVQARASHGNSINRRVDTVRTSYTTISVNE